MNFLRFIACTGVFIAATLEVTAASYYVDDGNTNGNIYTTAAGNDANAGTTPGAPKRTITNLLDSVVLVAGDIVYIDTGTYSNYTVTITNSGTSGNPIIFQGSTNITSTGTVISRNSAGSDVFGLRGSHLEFRNMTVANGQRGFNCALQFPPPSGLALDGVTVRGNSTALQRGNWTIRRSIFMNNNSLRDTLSSSFDFDHCVFWGNALDASSGINPITMNNSVYVGGDLAATITGDYNVFWDVRLLNQGRAYLYEYNMPNSTYLDPGFANPSASNFFPVSVVGRFNPMTGTVVTDATHSVLIDFGNIASTAWTNEPTPNGSRVNAGSYGGTALASRSRTNAWLQALTFNDGGAITGTAQTLVWNQGGFTNGATVCLQFSPDHGNTWSNIVTGVSVTNRSYSWNVTALSPMAAFWRVKSEANTNIVSANRQRFSVGGFRVPYYMNDLNTTNDYYTTAPGNDLNDGEESSIPMRTLTNLLSTFVLGKHDVIYVDTGVYSTNNTTDIKRYGADGQPLIIQGVPVAGATVFRRNAAASVFQLSGDHLLMRNVTIEGSAGNGAINGGTVILENAIVRSNAVAFRRVNITARNSVLYSNTTVIVSDTGSFGFDQCVFWGNGQIQTTARPWSVSNSVFVGGTINALQHVTGGDYCVFWGVTFDSLTGLNDAQRTFSNNWTYSSVLNPLFHNPEGFNFHPKSVTGRYDPELMTFVADAEHSPLIDFGNPVSSGWTNEPAPNGGRINAGWSGGMAMASKSRTNAWLQALSFNDGGLLSVPVDRVYWNAGNMPSGATVRIEFSFNAGSSWNVIGTNIAVTTGNYLVTATNFTSSRFARWRVVLEQEPLVLSSNSVNFIYRNGIFRYYVNDSVTAGDVYCTSIGSDANLGTTPDAPKPTIAGVLTNYTLEAGDIVYVDTGVYQSSTTISIPFLASGTNGNPVVIQGSTNYAANGSIIRGPPTGVNSPGFTLVAAVQDVLLRDFVIQRRTIGVSMSDNNRIGLEFLRIESNSVSGVSASGVSGLRLQNSSIRGSRQDGLLITGAGDASVLHSVLWMNGSNAVRTTGSRVRITNSVLAASGVWNHIYNAPSVTSIVANFNVLRVEQGASVAILANTDRSLNTLSSWQAETGMDRMSLDIDPQFANADGGDFHLRSQTIQGRFDPFLGWVTDTITSPLIDAGDPAYPFSHETAPNGGRANIGAFGNSPEASRTDIPRLFVGNLHQGGYIKGTSVFHWVAGSLASNELIHVQVSVDGGESWSTLTTGILASVEQVAWNTTTNAPAVAGLWRVQSVDNPTIVSQTTNFFGIRNVPLNYYINDSSTSESAFTTGAGSSTNWVASPARPLNSLTLVLDRYDLEPGDRVYMDRGSYDLTSPPVMEARHSGALTSGVVAIIGATTCSNGATPAVEMVGSGSISQVGLFMDQVRHVVVSNLAIRNSGTALSVLRGQNVHFDGLRIMQSSSNGLVVNVSSNVQIRRALITGSTGYGWLGGTNTAVRLINSVVVSNQSGAIHVSAGTLGITNSVLVVNESGAAIYSLVNNAVIRSDYNNLLADSLANIARDHGRLHKYPASWQNSTTNDLRSLSHDPGFYSESFDDYHLKSSAGRYLESGCFTAIDESSSVMIDNGHPSFSVGAEPAPNGGRINIGLYGGSSEASLSPTNGRLLTLSLNSGGTVRGTNTLYWSAVQAATNHLVYIDVSFNNGLTWTNIATNLNAGTGSYVWDASQLPSSALGRWRISSQNDATISATTEVAFILNNGSIGFFVNDTSTNGDIYASAAGLPENDGLSADTPVTSIASIFSRYQPGPGDIIYIDTGEYEHSDTIFLDSNNSGQITNPVVIKGSTNWVMGGSKINMKRQGPLFRLENLHSLTFSDLILTNAQYGIIASASSNLIFSRVHFACAANNANSVAFGFELESASKVEFDRVIIQGVTNSSESAGILIGQASGQGLPGLLTIRNSILWSNTFGIWAQVAAPVSMSNSIVHVHGANSIGLRFVDASQIQSDYNNYRVESGGRLAELRVVISPNSPVLSMPVSFTSIQAWREYTGRDQNSMTHDPGFANPSELDFGLLSSAGRWTPSGLVTDSVSSVLIDAGNPAWSVLNEPAPNGGRVNMGTDANTGRASLTPTNRVVTLLSYNDGGVARGTNVQLRWNLRGDFTGNVFQIQLSPNNGQTWQTITSGIPAHQLQYSWNSTEWASGFNRKWRVIIETEPAINALSEKAFVIRNTNFNFYVNDQSTSGDVYSASIGISTNTGLAVNQPKSSIQEVISTYGLLYGDTVYVDTGLYSALGNYTLTPRDEFALPGVITFIGSTNREAGGTVLQNGSFVVRDSRDTAIKHFTVRTASAGININSSTNIQVEWLHAAGAGHGISLENTIGVKIRHSSVIGARTNGIQLSQQNRQAVFEQGVIWTNQGFAVNPVNNIAISNSVLAASGSGKFIFSGTSNQSYSLNYNVYFITNGARLARLTFGQEPFPREFATLTAWRNVFLADANSMIDDPRFADPAGEDFHPRSTGGRWSVADTNFVMDVITSALVDSGTPDAPFAGELDPNGGRLNIGQYGNSIFASKSPVDADYLLVHLNDGGSVSGTNVALSWVARGIATGHVARVEVSTDGGDNWFVLASNIPPNTTSLSWNTTGLTSTVLGLWRITSEDQPSIVTTSREVFAIRNGPVTFYLNDHSMAGDLYTFTNGSASANGISPNSPLNSLKTLLDRYSIAPGDLIYMDTGIYSNNASIVVDQLDGGFRLIGSTNTPAGGTRLQFVDTETGILIQQAPSTQLENIRLSGITIGIRVDESDASSLTGIQIEGGLTGIQIARSDDISVQNSSVRGSGIGISVSQNSDVTLNHLVIWSNQQAAVKLSQSDVSLQNSVLGIFGDAETIGIDLDANSTWVSDYNLFDRSGAALIGRRVVSGSTLDLRWQRVSTWSRDTENDLHSLSGDPAFANVEVGDFHPRSSAGRYNITTGSFTNDLDTSVLIDAGSLLSAYSLESGPNGNRVNIGMYGNHVEASRSPTNGRLSVVRLNDGGRAEGSFVPLTWVAYGAATGHTVRLEVSYNDGDSWSLIQSNVPANAEILFWDSQTNAAWFGRWRLTSEQMPAISGTSADSFAVRNAGLSLYMNDISTVGDIYTETDGNDGNSGIEPSQPRATLQSLLDSYDLEPGDTIYVDTGDYTLNTTIQIGRFDAWNDMHSLGPLAAGGTSLRIQGSTNDAPNGSRFTRIGSGNLINIVDGLGVHLSHLDLRHNTSGGGVSIDLSNSPYVLAEWCRLMGGTRGVSVQDSRNTRIRHVLARNFNLQGIYVSGSTQVDVRQSVLWSNSVGLFVENLGSVNARNNVIAALQPNHIGWQRNDGPTPNQIGTLTANYNLLWSVNTAFIAQLIGNQYAGGSRRFERMDDWNEATGLDLQSMKSDPYFADVLSDDFHPRSPFGRYQSGSGYVTNELDEISPLIDTGDSSLTFASEISPNGSRINMGLYGNSSQSSLSPTSGSLQILTFRDGGAASGEITLRWAVSGPVSSHLMTLEFSNDGGSTWTNIASNVTASAQTYVWDSEPYGRAAAGLWRITSQQDSALTSQTERFFALRQGGTIPYYINDTSSDGDVYCTALGNDANTGFLPSTPKATLQSLLDEIDLEPGDVVYMDTGTYAVNLNVLWGELDSGAATNPVVLRGSTNFISGGTVMDRITQQGSALLISKVEGLTLQDMTFVNGSFGVSAEVSQNIKLKNVVVLDNSQAGIRVAGSDPVTVENCLIWDNPTNGIVVGQFSIQQQQQQVTRTGHVTMRNNTIWGSRYGVRIDNGGNADLRNNLFRVNGSDSRVYFLGIGLAVTAEYNAYYRQNGALMAERQVAFGGNEFYAKLLDWQRDQGNDLYSLSHEPNVADSANGDFHLISAAGRFLPTGQITNDSMGLFSPLIDTGDPASVWTNESMPNGGRINIGRFGNTPEASRSRTNGWLLALTLNDGGRISGTNIIRWAAGNWPTSSTVRLEYANDGVDFTILTTNQPVYQGEYTWDASEEEITQLARWRVVSEQDLAVSSTVQSPFVIKNNPLIVYVDDGETNGNVYTFATSSSTNSGTLSSPLDDPGVALERFPFSEGDILYIDTGAYQTTNATGLRLGLVGDTIKGGLPGDPVWVIGSTNRSSGGSVILSNTKKEYGFRIFQTAHIALEHLNFRGFTNGVLIENSEDVSFNRVNSYNNDIGFKVFNIINARFDRSASWNNDLYGISLDGGFSSAAWNQGVLWSNQAASVHLLNGQLSVSNSILVGGTNSLLYLINSQLTVNRGDYNVYWLDGRDLLMTDTFGDVDYRSVRQWQRARHLDTNSFVSNPRLANPAPGGFHLMSEQGRYVPASSNFVPDGVTSWAIDAGSINSSFNLEPIPNGGRLNVGLHGNTLEASKSSTNRGLFVVSLRDGGTAASPQPLIWLSSGLSTTDTVRIEYTLNNGIDWFVLATNVPAMSSSYTWVNQFLESTPLGRWRIILESDEAVQDITEKVFKIRNGPIFYYVNDTNLTGDVYTAEPGSPLNNGITVSTPVHTVQAIFEQYELEGGDVLYIDTGVYTITNNIVIRADDSGAITNRITIQGSTNRLAGGTRIFREVSQPWSSLEENNEAVFELIRAGHYEITDLLLENANIGIYVNNPQSQADQHYLRNLEIRDGGFFGIKFKGSNGNIVEKVLIHRMAGKGIYGTSSGSAILSSVVWSNRNGAVEWGGGALFVSNSVLHAYGGITNALLSLDTTTIVSDYNNYFVQGEATYVIQNGESIVGLPQWTQLANVDLHTISVDPLFADPAGNNYYPRSPAGRFNPGTETFVTSDTEYSWLIDTGDPLAQFASEPSPNGSRRNIGLHGGTEEASKSRGDSWLLSVTAMAGGRIGGIFPLHWFYGNLDPTNRVHLDFSVDRGTNWFSIVSNLQISVDGFLWNSESAVPFNQSPTTKWRVRLAGDTNIYDETDTIFGLNGPFKFFINDTNLADDVFTTAVGDDSNLGISSNAPKATLRAILDSWDIDPEDSVYADTGNYMFQSNDVAVVRINNRGASGRPVKIIGTVNGSVMDGLALIVGGTPVSIITVEAPFIEIDRINLRNGRLVASGTNIVLRNMSIDNGSVQLSGQFGEFTSFILTNGTVEAIGPDMIVRSGYVKDGSLELVGPRASMSHTVVAGSMSPLVKIAGTNVTVINNTLVAGRTAISQSGADSRSFISNNIIVADGALGTAYAIERTAGVIQSDYNLFLMRNGAWYGNASDGLWERLLYWQEKSGQDFNSITDDPLFADEAGGDYRLRSVTGRYSDGVWVTDMVHSVAIDAGAASDSFANEPSPNGSRINVGAYGNTEQASKSRTSPWLYAITMNDGGVIRGTNTLRWLYGAMDSTNRVMIQYSANGGGTWFTIASDLEVNDGSFIWDTTTALNSLDAVWRIMLQTNTNVQDQTDTIFNIRNDVRSFYVNDLSTTGDVYTTAIGNPANDGQTPATPKSSLSDLLNTYDTEPFDTVYVDTGIYTNATIQVIWSRSGNSNGFMTIRGSTNVSAGGSVIKRQPQSGDNILVNGSYIALQNLAFENSLRGIHISTNHFVLLEQLDVRSNQVGVSIFGGGNHTIRSSRIVENSGRGIDVSASAPLRIENITFVNNALSSINFGSNVPGAVIQNNIFYQDMVTSNQQFAISGPTSSVLTAFIDYNVYYFGSNSTNNAFIYGNYNKLLNWQREQSRDFRSVITNPMLVSVTAGDYHLQSQFGRYDPQVTGFVFDAESSWAIDKGNPDSVFSLEPEENGGRINVGAYGNTPYASKGTTSGVIFVRTGNGVLPITEAENPYPLVWHVLNLPEDLTVSVQYSGDGGNEWITLESGVPIYKEYIIWTNSPTFNSFDARWRIVGEGPGNTNYWDINDGSIRTFFGVHRISKIQVDSQKRNQFIWRGAWNEDYQLQYATNSLEPMYRWSNLITVVDIITTNTNTMVISTNTVTNVVFNYSATITNRGTILWNDLGAVTNLVVGGDTTHTDLQSTNDLRRLYRVIWLGTNGVPYQ